MESQSQNPENFHPCSIPNSTRVLIRELERSIFHRSTFACLCHLLISFANSFHQDRAQQNVGPLRHDLEANSLKL